MESVPYVSDSAGALAREFEARFKKLPPIAGVMFVSVSAVPIVGGNTNSFQVILGMARWLTESAGLGLVQQLLSDELSRGTVRVTAKVILGTIGACRDESAASAYSNTSAKNVAV